MRQPATAIERQGRTAVVHLTGDLVIASARRFHGLLRGLTRRRDVSKVILDFGGVGRLDSSGIAIVEIARRSLKRAGKEIELDQLDERKRKAFDLVPKDIKRPETPDEPGWLEWLGDRVLLTWQGTRQLGSLVGETARGAAAIVTRRAKLPAGAFATHVLNMGTNAVFIVGMLSFLLGMTIAFQGAVQLQRFGAGVFVADMVGMSMVREFAPMMTAIVLTGRTGAAIAAELGTMRVGSEIDALTAMGISPVRFLVVPRVAALTLVQPALTLIGMFIGIAGGMLVASLILDMSPLTFWLRMVERLTLADFAQGIGKSFVFAWIIGFAGSHLGLRASGDASSVGSATTRAVVSSIFAIIVVDAIWATISTLVRGHV
jgi:phospholipid/cholesterol/gamma-HCH transport system permease protein